MVNLGITERDLEILKFINFFGKSYVEVISKCFFPKAKTIQVCRNRLATLKNKYKLIKYTETGAIAPRSYISLSEGGRAYFENELGIPLTNTFFSLATLSHNINEQITCYALQRVGKEVIRTTVKNWSKNHHHTPDLAYYNKDKLVYVEIENTKKTRESYDTLFEKFIKDGVSNVIYVAKSEKWKNIYLEFLPKWDKLRVADIDSFFDNAIENGKIKADRQAN